MTTDFIQLELFAIFIAVGISLCLWGIWKIIYTLAKEYDTDKEPQTVVKAAQNEIPLDKIRAEIERLHYHPKLDFIKNDEVVEMALDIIDKYKGVKE